jgi:hypothetical protein
VSEPRIHLKLRGDGSVIEPPPGVVTAPASLIESALVDEIAACRPRQFAVAVTSRDQALALIGSLGPRLGARVLRSSASLETPGARLVAIADVDRTRGALYDRVFIPSDLDLPAELVDALATSVRRTRRG